MKGGRALLRPALVPTALVVASVALAGGGPALARPSGPVLHEPVPPDPREDLAMHVLLDGDLPAALSTPAGVVAAPDPRQPPRASESTYGPGGGHDTFVPDRETKRPDVGGYDDPFTPSNAPFKRLEAFDAVRSDERLYVRDPRLAPVPTGPPAGPDDELFFADVVVDVAPDRIVRVPSVAPGARIVRAVLGAGASDVPMRLLHDGADNWFLQAYGARGSTRARLVVEVAVARAAFGGPFGDPGWNDLPLVPPLPDNVAREAAVVRAAIGVGRRMRPTAALARLVEYFRGFVDSDQPPRGRRSVYLDLALSKKGVCRHRAFAFMITAQSLGIPARVVLNEAHAWVEVHDGALWRRIDLGGAGRLAPQAAEQPPPRAAYDPPADAFAWPRDAERGDDMMAELRARGASSSSPGARGTSADGSVGADPARAESPWSDAGGGPAAAPSVAASARAAGMPPAPGRDDRPVSTVSIAVVDSEAHRGRPLRVRGEVRADSEPCAHVAVEVWLRAAERERSFLLGSLATADDGAFSGAIVLPPDVALGDYDVVARTRGDVRCGAGTSE